MGKTKQPKTRAEDLVEIIHGTEVRDPYRWLEDVDSSEVQNWISAQNAYSKSRMDRIKGRPKLRERLKELLDTDFVGPPTVRENILFYYKQPAGVEQIMLCMREFPDGKEEIIVDPNQLSEDGSIALAETFRVAGGRPSENTISKDGKLVAYGLSKNGSDWAHWRILNIETGEHLSDEFPRISGPGISWLPDNSGFYYSRSPGKSVDELERTNGKVFFHALGTDWTQDPLVFGEELLPQEFVSATVTDEGKHVLYKVFKGWGKTELYIQDFATKEMQWITESSGGFDVKEVKVIGEKMYLLTNHKAPRFQLSVTSVTNPDPENWETIIPEGDGVIENFNILGDQLFVQDKVNVADRVREYSLDGSFKREIALPTMGTTEGPK